MLKRLKKLIGKVPVEAEPVEQPTYFRINDWIDIMAQTTSDGVGHLYVFATCKHKKPNPPIRSVREKLHRYAEDRGMPEFELHHKESREIDGVEAYMLGHDVKDEKYIRMVHKFEVKIVEEKK